ncbi:MAG: hypothetical protein KKF95_04070, partial [Nanoarchaeota archaeon]|nr:hypothetical protein [Nanoarchaeota archaeon]
TVKEVRRKLREIYGVFIDENYSKKEHLLKNLNRRNEKETVEKILKLHTSTNERLPYYKEVYQKIFKITGRKKIILDLACGLNPLSYKFLGYKPVKYIASDISSEDLKFIALFFKKMKISGKTIKIDLVREQEKLQGLKAGICFMFKTLDSLETQKKNTSRTLIDTINAEWIVISFPKTSLGGYKTIKKSKRQWFVNFLKHNNHKHQSFETLNEFFFVIEK